MQPKPPDALFAEVEDWHPVGQYELICRLAESFGLEPADDGEPELNDAQWAEIERRMQAVDRGEVELIPAEQVLAEIRAHREASQEAHNRLPPDQRPRPVPVVERDILGLPDPDRHAFTRRLLAHLARDPVYTDEMHAIDSLLVEWPGRTP